MLAGLATGRGLALAALLASIVWFWLPALRDGKLIIHGDAAHHGLALFWLHAKALAGKDALLWADRIYGGHPLFAEGQGGFVNPVNILSAWLFEPVRAFGVFHWLSMSIGGAGVFCLCRILGIGRWSAAFAGIAVTFSGAWLNGQHNTPISAGMAWLPWLFAATEYWIERPSALRAGLVSMPAALLVFAGYPQVAHGAALYVLASLVAQFVLPESRAFTRRHWRTLVFTGLLAIVLAVGLAAIQLLPLFELVGQSHRNQGIAIAFNGTLPAGLFLRGLFYFYLGTDVAGINQPNLASIVVPLLAGLILFVRAPARIIGQALGAFLLFNLALGNISPLFRIAYAYHLIPGLHYFRIMSAYFPAAVVGIAVVAAFVLDAFSRAALPQAWRAFNDRRVAACAVALYVGGFIYLCVRLYAPVFSAWNFLAPLALTAMLPLLFHTTWRRWIPLLAVATLCADTVLLRIPTVRFFERQAIEMPATIQAIAADRGRAMDDSSGGMLSFLGPADPTLRFNYRRLLGALSPFPMALQAGIPSINGVLALPLSRRALLDPVFRAEIDGKDGSPPGLRMIDILGVRYISRDTPVHPPGVSLYDRDTEHNVLIYRNDHAGPRFRIYENSAAATVAVVSPEQAIAGLKQARTETLFIEMAAPEKFAPAPACVSCDKTPARIDVVEAGAMRYRLNVETARPGWLFIADANYPGWEATVNGESQRVFAAQVLGKAIGLKAGRSIVEIRYVPRMFYRGAMLSGATAVLILCLVLRAAWRNRKLS